MQFLEKATSEDCKPVFFRSHGAWGASQGPAELVFGWSAAFPTNSGKLHNCSA